MKIVVDNTSSIHARIVRNLRDVHSGKAVNPFCAIAGLAGISTVDALHALRDLVAAGIVERSDVPAKGIGDGAPSTILTFYRFPVERLVEQRQSFGRLRAV
jgi:hypothetical protein